MGLSSSRRLVPRQVNRDIPMYYVRFIAGEKRSLCRLCSLPPGIYRTVQQFEPTSLISVELCVENHKGRDAGWLKKLMKTNQLKGENRQVSLRTILVLPVFAVFGASCKPASF